MTITIEAKALLNNRSIEQLQKELDENPVHKLHKMRMCVCELIGLTSVLYRGISFCSDDYEEQILDKAIGDLGGDTCLLTIMYSQLRNLEKDLTAIRTFLKETENAKNEPIQE